MRLHFYKYQGAGNDFVLIDNRDGQISLNTKQIAFLCDRHFGIGADGLMLLELENGYDFRMVYFNADGKESTMCGNGGRCIVAFAHQLGIIKGETTFIAIDGPHRASIHEDKTVSLQMVDVTSIHNHEGNTTHSHEGYTILNTGSPHYVAKVKDVANVDVFHIGRAIRNQDQFQPNGINVNFVEKTEDHLYVRTYERGVEDETLSCGTGVTAAAIASVGAQTGNYTIPIQTPGGNLEVKFEKKTADTASNVVLKGPAQFVFEGDISLWF